MEGHIIYLAGLLYQVALRYHQYFDGCELNTMLSYGRRGSGYHSTFIKNCEIFNRIVLDSGTWSLYVSPSKKNKITFTGYLSYLNSFARLFYFYVNFDLDFSKHGFITNLGYQQQLEVAGLNPVFVIHDCSSQREINYCLNSKPKMVAIGSGELSGKTAASFQRLSTLVNQFHDAGIKVHLLGCTDFKKLAQIPVYSCDSSTWTRSAGEGYVKWWNPNRHTFDKTDSVFLNPNGSNVDMAKHVDKYKYQLEFEDYLRTELDIRLSDIKGRGLKPKLLNRQFCNIHYYVQLQKRIREEHRKRGFKF